MPCSSKAFHVTTNALGLFSYHVDVFKQEHISYSLRCPVIEACFMIEPFGILKSSEEDIKQGKVGIVESVNSSCMMYSMALRPLNDVSQPHRCFNIGVLEYAEEIAHQ